MSNTDPSAIPDPSGAVGPSGVTGPFLFDTCNQKASPETVELQIQSRHGSQRMRFPRDSDTTRRLKFVITNSQPQLPWWRRLLRYLN